MPVDVPMPCSAAITTEDTGVLPSTPREALAAASWLAGVPANTLDGLAARAALHRLPAGSTVFEQAETPSFAQFLIAGSVEILAVRGREEVLVELVRPVDLLLPAAVLNRLPYLLRARVMAEATLLMVHADRFREAVSEDHAFCLAVLGCQAMQFRRRVKGIKNVRLRSAEERVGCYLLRLVEGAPEGVPVRLPMEKRLIASELGMTRETFSRSLGLVARHGIRVDGDLVALEDAAEARARFALDPLIDGTEAFNPLLVKGASQ